MSNVVLSRPPENVECGHFALLCGRVRQRNAELHFAYAIWIFVFVDVFHTVKFFVKRVSKCQWDETLHSVTHLAEAENDFKQLFASLQRN